MLYCPIEAYNMISIQRVNHLPDSKKGVSALRMPKSSMHSNPKLKRVTRIKEGKKDGYGEEKKKRKNLTWFFIRCSIQLWYVIIIFPTIALHCTVIISLIARWSIPCCIQPRQIKMFTANKHSHWLKTTTQKPIFLCMGREERAETDDGGFAPLEYGAQFRHLGNCHSKKTQAQRTKENKKTLQSAVRTTHQQDNTAPLIPRQFWEFQNVHRRQLI